MPPFPSKQQLDNQQRFSLAQKIASRRTEDLEGIRRMEVRARIVGELMRDFDKLRDAAEEERLDQTV